MGNVSGPSDQARAETPWVVRLPEDTARVGERYTSRPEVIRTIGDLRTIVIDGNPYNAAFRDGDLLTFVLKEGPGWLTVSKAGELTGVAPEKGSWQVRLSVESTRGGRDEIAWRLTAR